MTEKTSYAPGEFCWWELATNDQSAATKFYCGLFGWSANAMPAGPDQPPYVMLSKGGKDAAALYENKKLHPRWNSYVSVASADDSAAKAQSLGGKIVNAPFDVMDVGRMANLQDPEGVTFAVWQPGRHIGARIINEPGAVCWTELDTRDIEKARKFYASLFDWKLKISPEYTEFGFGGMMQMNEHMRGVPPQWVPYFAVENCDTTAKQAESAGARIYAGPMDIPKVGRFAMLGDPQGATFAIFTLSGA